MKQYIGTKIIQAEPAYRVDGKVFVKANIVPSGVHIKRMVLHPFARGIALELHGNYTRAKKANALFGAGFLFFSGGDCFPQKFPCDGSTISAFPSEQFV